MENFNIIAENIRNRRSVKPALLNGKKIQDEDIKKLLELANWAPTHAMTEPWRFVVYAGEAVRKFSKDQAELYKSNTSATEFNEAKYEKLLHNGDKASHIIIAYMKRGNNPKIPALEEICATAAAVENLLLGASALGIAVLWSTGGVTHAPVLKEYLHLRPEDEIIAMLYLGYSDTEKKGVRVIPIEEKTTWVK